MSPEANSNSTATHPAEMLQNADVLMQPELMQQVLTDPESVVRELQEQPDALEGREAGAVVEGARNALGFSVIGPELATKAVHQESDRAAQEAGEQIQYGTRYVSAVAEHLQNVPGRLKSVQEDLPLARRYVHQLRDILSDAHSFDPQQARGMVARMRTFADEYGIRVRSVSQAYEEAGAEARRGLSIFEEADESLRRSINRIDEVENDSSALAAAGYDQSTLEAVQARGATGLQQHASMCYEECETEKGKVTEAWNATRKMGEEMRGLAGSVNMAAGGLSELPHPSRLGDEIDGLNSNFYQIEYQGPMMARLALETLDRIDHQLRILDNRLDEQTRLSQSQRQGVERLQEECMRLRQLPLFAGR